MKNWSALRLIYHFPDPSQYTTFVEVCGGAAHVTFAKPAGHHVEIYNDLSNNLVTFWEQIQCHADIMQQRLDTTLYSRKIYYTYYRSLFDGTVLEPLERAIRYFYVLRSTGTGWVDNHSTFISSNFLTYICISKWNKAFARRVDQTRTRGRASYRTRQIESSNRR